MWYIDTTYFINGLLYKIQGYTGREVAISIRRYFDMKKGFIITVIVFSTFILFSSCTTMSTSDSTPLYSTKEYIIQDIAGDIKVSEMLIYKTKDENLNIVYLDRGDKSYAFSLDYYGKTWEFYETLSLKIDDKTYTLIDKTPTQNVLSSGYVTEYLSFYVNETIVNALREGREFTLQYKAGFPVVLEQAAVDAIKSFLYQNN